MATQETKAKRAARQAGAANLIAALYQSRPDLAAARVLPSASITDLVAAAPAGSGITPLVMQTVAGKAGLTITDGAASSPAGVPQVYGPGGTASAATAQGSSSGLLWIGAALAALFMLGRKRKR